MITITLPWWSFAVYCVFEAFKVVSWAWKRWKIHQVEKAFRRVSAQRPVVLSHTPPPFTPGQDGV